MPLGTLIAARQRRPHAALKGLAAKDAIGAMGGDSVPPTGREETMKKVAAVGALFVANSLLVVVAILGVASVLVFWIRMAGALT